MWHYVPDEHRTGRDVRGRPLRYLLVALLADHRCALTIPELTALCANEGVVFNGRPSKIISDALRWEVAKGRIARLRRGIYCYNRAPRSTLYWIRQKVQLLRERLAQLQGPATHSMPDTLATAVTETIPILGSGLVGYPGQPTHPF